MIRSQAYSLWRNRNGTIQTVRNANSMVLVDCLEIVWNHDNTIIVYHLEVGISNRLDSTVSGPAGGCTLGYISYTARTVNLQKILEKSYMAEPAAAW